MKKFWIGLAILVGVIGVLGIVAPKDFQVEREVVINRPKAFVYENLKFIKNHDSWSPWVKRDPQMTKSYKGTDGTVGFIYSWSGNSEVGVGEQEIKKIVEGERIETELRFKEPFEDSSQAYLITETVGENQTKVRWGMVGKSPFPINILCLIMNATKKIGNDFEEGLGSLKTNLEK